MQPSKTKIAAIRFTKTTTRYWRKDPRVYGYASNNIVYTTESVEAIGVDENGHEFILDNLELHFDKELQDEFIG